MSMMRRGVAVILMLATGYVFADQPTCTTDSGGGICNFRGLVKEVRINRTGRVSVYFDRQLDPADAAAVGFNGVTKTGSAIIETVDYPDAAKSIYAGALTAKIAGRRIHMTMRGVSGAGFMRITSLSLRD